jgi:parallel beta-helix repeat protein
MISIDPDEDAIRIKGIPGTIATLSQIYLAVGNKQIIEKLGNREWILRKNLFIDEGVTLIVDGEEVEWLKLKSDKQGFCWIKSEGGNIVVNRTKITSWNEEKMDFDSDLEDGRSYVLQKSSGRMDIIDSELAYLGYLGSPNRGNPFGGPYGISWKILDGTFRDELVTGSLISSKIHHNFFGAYTFGATGIVFRDNDVYNNIEYGIDPHDDSNNLLIENNRVFWNGNHGIIASKNCFNNIIKNNNSSYNKLHGIMLDRNSNNNLISDNNCSGNINGIALYHSSENLIEMNSLFENQFAIRANNNSDNNFFTHNLINASKKGIFLYDSSLNNYIYRNTFLNTETGVHLKGNSTGFTSEENGQDILDQKITDGIF